MLGDRTRPTIVLQTLLLKFASQTLARTWMLKLDGDKHLVNQCEEVTADDTVPQLLDTRARNDY